MNKPKQRIFVHPKSGSESGVKINSEGGQLIDLDGSTSILTYSQYELCKQEDDVRLEQDLGPAFTQLYTLGYQDGYQKALEGNRAEGKAAGSVQVVQMPPQIIYVNPTPIENNILVQPAEVILPQMPKTATITSGPGGSKKLTVT